MCPERKPNRDKCQSWLLVCVDNALHINHNPDEVMHKLCKECSLKNDQFAKPDRCLGADVKRCELQNSSHWSMSACNCLKEACKVIKGPNVEDRRRWTAKQKNAMIEAHRPEIDTSIAGGGTVVTFHVDDQNPALGRMDITTKVSVLSAHSCLPREGHLEAACQTFECIKSHLNSSSSL